MPRSPQTVTTLPASPYIANRNKPLTAYVFKADEVPESKIDELVVCFLREIRDDAAKFKRPLEIWRGEITNAGGHFRCLAVSNAGRSQVYQKLLKTVSDYSCDSGSRTAVELALEPSLLVGADRVWRFDANLKPGTKKRVRFGRSMLDVTSLPYVWQKPPPARRGAAGGTLTERYNALARELSHWKRNLTNSAFANHDYFRAQYRSLLDANIGQFDYGLLKLVCERALCLHVVEIPMKELGRIVVTPQWEKTTGGLTNSSFSVRIAITPTAAKREQLAALAHELGHYVFHLPYHVFFARLPFAVMQNSEVETAVASQLSSLQAEYYRLTELQADLFAAGIMVPEGYGAWLNRHFITGRETPAAVVETQVLSRTLGHQRGSLSETEHERVLQQSARDVEARASTDYDPTQSLLDRIGWCIAHRENAATLVKHAETDGVITSALSALIGVVSNPASAPSPKTDQKLYRRLRLEDVEAFARNGTLWDPVVVEPRVGGKAAGYLGIKLAFIRGAASHGQTDWLRHPASNDRGPCAFASEWLEEAEASGRGLMLFPIDPAERGLRTMISRQGSLEALLQVLQANENRI